MNSAAVVSAPSSPPWYTRPAVILPLLGALVLVSALLARDPVSGRRGDPRLSTFSAAPLGARLLYELAGRLGWNPRRETKTATQFAPDDVYALLDPTIALRSSEAHEILESVRKGGALLLVLGAGTSALSDSLRVSVDTRTHVLESRAGDVTQCPQAGRPRFSRTGLWFGPVTLLALKGPALADRQALTLVYVRSLGRRGGDLELQPAMLAMPFGAGRIVVASDPDLFRNDALRDCSYGLHAPAVRALEYLRDGAAVPRRNVAFDEYHLGRGYRAGTLGAVETFLRDTRWGHAVLQLCAAGLLLLLAAAYRVLPPRDDPRVERRSPLEHVDALARAYSQAGASRTATARLVRGMRRRVDRGTMRARSSVRDEDFLDRVADAVPARAADAALVRRALGSTMSHTEFREVGSAVQRIEAALVKA